MENSTHVLLEPPSSSITTFPPQTSRFQDNYSNANANTEGPPTNNDSEWTEYFTQASGPYMSLVAGYILTYVKMEHLNQDKIPFKKIGIRLFTALFYVGAILGACWMGLVFEIFGRRGPLIETSVLISLVWVLRNFRRTEPFRACIRFFLGFTYGAFALGLPIYMTESSTVTKRGLRGFYYISDGLVGSLMGFCVLSYVKLKVLEYFLNHVILIGLVQIIFAAQSPYWHPPPPKSSAAAILAENFETVMTNWGVWKLLAISFGLMTLQEITCWLPMSRIMPSLLRQFNSNFTAENTQTLLILCQIMGVGGTAMLVDLIGRRPLLIVSLGMVGLSSIFFGIFLYHFTNEGAGGGLSRCEQRVKGDGLIWLGVICCCIFCVALNLGIRPIAWLTMAELLPVQGKGFLAAIVVVATILVSYLFDLVMTTTFFSSTGSTTGQQVTVTVTGLYWKMWILGSFSFLGLPYVFFLVPEMRGLDFPVLTNSSVSFHR